MKAIRRKRATVAALVGLIILTYSTETSQSDPSADPEGENSPTESSNATLNDRNLNLSTELEQQGRFRRRSKSTNVQPEFSAPIGNITAVFGRDVRLVCTVENLGQYQVAWLKEETRTILSIDTNIIITNYRIFLIPDEEERKWVLHIKDVQESDRGFYQCQVNTKPMRSTSGYLEVVVPPTIIEAQSSQTAEALEHSNVSLQCKANGHPRPTISWRRDDGQPIRLTGQPKRIDAIGDAYPSARLKQNGDEDEPAANNSTGANQLQPMGMATQLSEIRSDKLTFHYVDRSMAGLYVCAASNGIPGQVSKQIPLYVKFAPKTSVPSEHISISPGDELEIECLIEAFPKPRSYWSKKALPSSGSLLRSPLGGAAGGARWSRLAPDGERRAASSWPREFAGSHNSDTGQHAGHQHHQSQPIISSSRPQHPHNRISLRRAHGQQRRETQSSGEDDDESASTGEAEEEFGAAAPLTGAQFFRRHSSSWDLGGRGEVDAMAPAAAPKSPPAGSETSRAYVTVKQAAVNSHTYALRLSIARMRVEDFGEYTCVASNSMGDSESSVTLTRADRPNERPKTRQPTIEPTKSQPGRNPSEATDQQLDNYLRDTVNPNKQTYAHPTAGQAKDSPSLRRGSSSNRVVYDANYLQAIKTRQNNLAVSGKLQQRHKLGQFADRNSAGETRPTGILAVIFALIATCLLYQ